ncbi:MULTISPECIES: MATE family efflux transporter [Citrobacter]|uniref:MATE family efflux transporter n=1 Tax=Citrobacter TaxID=544 RepID=UPI000791BC8D|nr:MULTISPECIES: MATE family efflux transporter [Citrobacter]SAC93580.1 Polysaccharide biosynthesis protein [Enterobacter cloacae]KAA0568387.1 oligosaccharide flippase family protein [Citrobacter portucalensis]MDM2796622.1 oligosaccharide flippase family protein [Citrobacter sp. Cpo131]MDM2891297.1 oligosaccharide flippase family protein [Citrobacter sp. Cpo060]MDW2648569.1 oligosaccharide flippase family protein [Citrobacter portucalensis]
MIKFKLAFILRVIGTALTFFVSVLITRTISIQDAGYVFFIISFTSIVASLSTLGQNNLILKKCSSVKYSMGEKHYFFKKCLYRTCLSSIIFFSILLPVLIHYSNDNPYLWSCSYILLLLIMATACNILFYSYIQAKEKVIQSIYLQYLIQPAVLILLIWGCAYFFKGGEGVIASYLISMLLISVCMLIYLQGNKARFGYKDLKNKLSINFKYRELNEYFVGNSLGMIIVQSYVVISGLLLGASDVALIAVSDRISLIINLFAMSISSVLAPKVATLISQGNMDAVEILVKKTIVYLAIPCVLGVLVFSLFSDFILSIYGSSYEHGSNILIILVIAQVVNAVLCPIYIFLNMNDKQGFISKLHIYVLLPALSLTYFLTNYLGALGIAVSKLVVVCVINIIPAIYFITLIKVRKSK